MADLGKPWTGKRVFLTGHTGFKGGWLAWYLLHQGATVSGYALAPPTTPNLFDLSGLADHLSHHHGDVRNLDALTRAVHAEAPDVLFHLAAKPLVKDSLEHPHPTCDVNVVGTLNILQVIRQTPSLKTAVIVTSDKVYQTAHDETPLTEDAPLAANSPYAASKACMELLIQAWRPLLSPAHKTLASARTGNTLGGGDFTRGRLLPDILAAQAAHQPVRLRQPQSTRPFLHVLDATHGYATLALALLTDKPGAASAFNFGPNNPTPSVASLLDTAGIDWQTTMDTHTFPETLNLAIDSTKAYTHLGWKTRLSPTETIAWTLHWHHALRQEKPAHQLVHDQIQHYERLLAT